MPFICFFFIIIFVFVCWSQSCFFFNRSNIRSFDRIERVVFSILNSPFNTFILFFHLIFPLNKLLCQHTWLFGLIEIEWLRSLVYISGNIRWLVDCLLTVFVSASIQYSLSDAPLIELVQSPFLSQIGIGFVVALVFFVIGLVPLFLSTETIDLLDVQLSW